MLRALLLAAGLLSLAPTAAQAMRCGRSLIATGDSQARVQSLCGDPSDTAERIEERTVQGFVNGVVVTQTQSVVISTWTYNFGPRRLMQRLTFWDGNLTDITSLGRGYRETATDSRSQLQLGFSRDRVTSILGEPSQINRRTERRSVSTFLTQAQLLQRRQSQQQRAQQQSQEANIARSPNAVQGEGRASTVQVEVWTYNFGPRRFMKRLTFEDGRLCNIETLGRGY